MGTTRSGLYFNTQGSSGIISDYALLHSVEGTYVNSGSKDPKHPLRLDGGGHGQAMFKILKKANIGYNIVKTYPNGVRIGNVENHKTKAKRMYNAQAWFPKKWTATDILKAGEYVAKLNDYENLKDGVAVYGMYKGVKVGIMKSNGKIATIFPCLEQPEN